ncbi:putative RNA polymerase [Lyophyllum shimeji]|uniref:RNA-dependent RNA polymerase n=1 Tax=Lyophyllum shimeji TaxID=47721 RepID=A0A9P3UKE5_LYOSH|nr:putative RNA polymerase [Lyophyllum shimeji]
MLETHGLGSSHQIPSVMLGLAKLGVNNIYSGPFYRQMLEFAIHHVLRLSKNRARIPIRGAWTLVGVADVHKFLQEGEIFTCVKPSNGAAIYLEGPMLISRTPTIHPEPLPNTVIFSALASRPLPSCLGGGDLDGDIYNLIPLSTRLEFKEVVDHPSTTEAGVAEFVMEYINSDVVAIVATDRAVALHSDAVDYPKTGNPVALNRIPKLRFGEKPDWNAPRTVKPDSAKYYVSN